VGVVQGPLIDMAVVEKVEGHIADAVAKGASVVGGHCTILFSVLPSPPANLLRRSGLRAGRN
jgi:hypothetical protein